MSTLGELPGVSQQALQQLHAQMSTGPRGPSGAAKPLHASHDKKTSRLVLKEFLKVCAGAKIEAWKRPPSVRTY